MLFTKKLSVGNRILDAEHEKLHGLISALANAIRSGDNGVVPDGFERLEMCLLNYFTVTECIADAVGFNFEKHRKAHRSLLEKIRKIENRLHAEQSLSEREKTFLANTLSDQLTQHILFDCNPLKVILDTHYYDFRPDNLLPA